MRVNTTKAKLSEGQVVFGGIISGYAPELVELLGAIGYDFVMLDCEHGPMSLDQLENMVRAAEVFGDLGTAERVSVVVPGVDTDVLSFERQDDPARAPVGMARSLYAAERAAAPRTSTAVIAMPTSAECSSCGPCTRASTGARKRPRLSESSMPKSVSPHTAGSPA